MGTLRNEAQRRELVERLGRLRPEARALWGQLDAARMLCHVADSLDAGLGRLAVPLRQGPAVLRHFPMKQLALYVIPMPKGAHAPTELLAKAPGDFESDRRQVVESMERSSAASEGMGPDHFLFGAMTMAQWNALQWKHIDHHLRQFGC